MGGFSSKTEEDLKIYLQRDYDVENYPLILNKVNKKKAFVHQITTDSREQAQRIRRDVNLYKHLGCKSINQILEYVPLQSSKICSEQQYHYILQARDQQYDLKEEFFARKYYKEGFSTQQLINIIKTYLCGLKVFHQQFHRNFRGNIGLESITIDQTHFNQLRMTDPLLQNPHLFSHIDLNSKIQSINSPLPYLDQKIITIEPPQRSKQKKSRFNQKQVKLNQLLADIYIIGVIVLQLYKMQIFQKKQTHQTLHTEVQNIRNQDLKTLLNVMTAYNPDERSKVYDILNVSKGDSYFLQRSFRKGKSSKNEIISIDQNLDYVRTRRENVFKRQNNFSFGDSFDKKHIPLRQGFDIINNGDIKMTNTFEVNENTFLVNKYKKEETSERTSTKKIQFKRQNHSPSLQLKILGKDSTSNMSTERTFNSNMNTSRSVSKPIVSFNQQNSVFNLSLPFKSINQNTSSYLHNKLQFQNRNIQPINTTKDFTSIFVNKTDRSPDQKTIQTTLFKQTINSRANSFLFTEQNKLPTKITTQQSPFKKHQNISPISHYQHSRQKIEQKNMTVQNQFIEGLSNITPFPSTHIQNKKVEQQIKLLLKQPSRNQNLITKTEYPVHFNNNIFPIPNQASTYPISNLSPISFQTDRKLIDNSQVNQITKFTYREKNHVQQSQYSIRQNLPIYRPNKEVEEILKRLGIGSLLYGEEQKQGIQKNIHIPENDKEYQSPDTPDSETTTHKGIYKINDLSKPQIQPNPVLILKQQQQLTKPQTNQETPIRVPKKPKFNSTIVQVGDEDSQYSESVKNNDQSNIDLTLHEYVVEEYQTGSRYEGYKLNGERDGQGKFYYQDGGYYQGQWRANKMHGWGKLFYEGGKIAYQGNWSQDQFHGFGKVYNDNPIQLECGFDFTNFDLLQDYWEYYEGMLVKDTKEGRGKIMLTNSEMFEGDFHNDRIQGFGKFFMKDGTIIEGIWRDSKLIKIIS